MFLFSTETFSTDETSRFIVPILKFLSPNMTLDQQMFWHHVIRKAAHITEFCVLGILTYRAIRVDVSSLIVVRMLTVAFVALAALMDEFHQSFVPSRESSIVDVGYDCIGGVVSLLLVWLWSISRATEE